MNRKSIVVLIITLLCLAAASTAIAQGDKPDGSDVAVGATFTYQGQIKRNGALFNGACDMRFTLWDAATGGLQVAAYTPPTQVPVTGGVYTVEVDFGNQFKGEARWIQTEAKCADDTGYTTLPRVALNPTPYAIGLIPGAQVSGNIAGTAGVLRVTNNGAGAALLGLANSSTGATYGVLGNAFSPTGYAVSGYADGGATAVYGYSNAGGAGVVGESIGFEGVRGVAYDVNHGAVVGIHKGGGFGVYGDSTTGAGVVGKSSSWVGVYGESSTQTAVWGKSTNASGVVGSSTGYIGVYGESTNYEGVRGTSHNASHAGVVGVNDAAGGIGVYGIAPNGGYAAYFAGKVGIQGADLAERFAAVDNQSIEPGTIVAIDANHAGKIMASNRPYDPGVIGIVSGAGGIRTALTLHQDDVLEGDLVVAIAGRVYCKAEADSAPIKPGDLLTTSKIKGHCMKAADRDQAYGAIVGKALTGLDQGEGLVLVLVNLQ